jgi:small subunit ribosomal protein S6
MRSYECAVILHPAVSDDGLKASTAKYVDIIARTGGEITRVETWGKRRLSFEIMKQPEGHYFFYKFRGANTLVDELGRQLRIDENVLRHMIVRDEQATGDEAKLEGPIEPSFRQIEREREEDHRPAFRHEREDDRRGERSER